MFSDWVKKARLDAGMNQEQLANQIGTSKANISSWEHGRHSPNLADVLKIAVATRCPVPDDVKDQIVAASKIGEKETGVFVPLLENSGEMGGGAEALETDVIAKRLPLTEGFVSRLGADPKRLRFIGAYGDSMEPTIGSGDVLLVDTGINQVNVDGVYVLRTHGRLFVKRVRQRLSGEFEVSSDNPNHDTVDTLNGDFEVEVIGRVIYVWHGNPL